MSICFERTLDYKKESQTWKEYKEHLYNIYYYDFHVTPLSFKGKPVKIKETPKQNNGNDDYTFYKLTNRSFKTEGNAKHPDFERSARIRWVRKIIENTYNCDVLNCDDTCNGILIWEEYYGKNRRIHLLHVDGDFLVVLEQRKNIFLLITSFFIDETNRDYYDNKYENNKINWEDI